MLKTLGTQLALLTEQPQVRQNFTALFRFLVLLVAVVGVYTVAFHVLMIRVEGQEHTWFTGLYWTLVTMSTLGFGDITFTSDIGRMFSILVLFSGVFLFLILLPFVFIRYLYAPWLEAQIRTRAPRSVDAEVQGHVIFCNHDAVAVSVIEQLRIRGIPYVLIESDPERAANLHADGLKIMRGDLDDALTFVRAGADRARLVVANANDVTNTNIILTVRQVSGSVPVISVASSEDAVDIMELAGATRALALRRELGERLANRINAGHAQTHVLGRFRDLVVAEFAVRNTPFVGKTIRETRLRELMGLNVVGVWEQADLEPARPDRTLTDQCLPVVIGTEAQMRELDEILYIYDTNWSPVIVIGGGKVGRAATRRLKRNGLTVHLIEQKEDLAARWSDLPDQMFVGTAANRELLDEAGIQDAPAVLLTTNDDAMNVFLSVYCRRLNPTVRIVSRVTHERNIASIRRAGADLVLSYAALGMEAIVSMVRDQAMVLLGEGIELFEEALPKRLEHETLASAKLRERTGVNVVAIERKDSFQPAPRADEPLQPGSRLYMIGTPDQHQSFRKEYGIAVG